MNVDLTTRLRLARWRLRGSWRQTVNDWHERWELRRFQDFYARLADPENVFFIFFTSDLLHWLARALELVPEDVNVVLIGSDLGSDEIAWVTANMAPRPFHHIGPRLDDNSVLDFVFKTAAHNFGWLHIDCLVLNPELFAEMTRIDDDVAINCIWSHPGVRGITTLHSAFVFVNHRVLTRVRETGVEVSPVSYHYQGSSLGRTITRRRLYCRVPTSRQVALLARVLPPDAAGLPQYPSGEYFQVLVLYQLLANALGYRLHHARNLVRDGSPSAAQYSPEIIHVNGVATYKRYKAATATRGYRFYPLLLQADYAILNAWPGPMPERYRALAAELRGELARLDVAEEETIANISGFLMERGLGREECARILGLDPAAIDPEMMRPKEIDG